MISKYLFIVNPGSNHGKSKTYLNKIKNILRVKNIGFEYKITRSLNDAYLLSRKANLEGYKIIVSVGGDGTINKVINGFYDENGKRISKATLGVIHTGTSPDFCKSYGIPTDFEGALDSVLKECSKEISVAKIEYFSAEKEAKTGYFACCSSFGLGAEVAGNANSGIRKYLGDFAGTLVSIIRSIMFYRPSDIVVHLDKKDTVVKNNFNTFVGKTSYIASGMKVHHNLTDNDDRLYILSLKNINWKNFIPSLIAIYSGRTIKPNDHISFDYAETVKIIGSKRNTMIEFDGDPQGHLPCSISIAEDKLGSNCGSMMNFESKIIKLINDIMPDSPLRKSNCFEVDSEVIQLGDEKYLFTTDDFSAEDLFRDDDPYTLGWNIACASISDIIASGGKPLVYSHSMVISKAWDEKFIEQFSKGISEVLKIYSVSFIGGDLGISENWRYTSTVIGKPMGKMINRKGIGLNDTIFITGKIGAGNLQAAMNLFSHDDRVKEMQNIENDIFRTNELLPEILTEFASASIDTSDGVFSALRTLSELNGKGFRINALPYIGNGINISEALKLPIELFFLGECGEYEILFTVNENKRDDLLEAAREKKIDIFEIGKFTDDKNEKIISMNNKIIDLNHYDLNARDFTNVRDYLNKVIIWLNSGSD